ncbi:non-homologous end joining protein Ku [Bradyrhizobium sp. OAE829]
MAPRAYWKGSLKLSLVTCPASGRRKPTKAGARKAKRSRTRGRMRKAA